MTSITFVAFCALVRFELSPAQRVLVAIAFDGVEPSDLVGEDREYARALFGDIETIPPIVRAVVCVVAGARGGKTRIAATRLLHLALTVPLSLAPGEWAFALFVAPDLRLARQGLRYARGAAATVPAIDRLVIEDGADGFTIERPDGARVRLECLPASRGGSAVRGRTLVAAVLDEACFFRDEDSGVVNDGEVFRAIVVRVVRAGQLLIISTPWLASGLTYELHDKNHGKPTTALAAHAPTLLLRGDEHTRSIVERERERDPDNARREYDAEFLDLGTSGFFDPAAIDRCVELVPEGERPPREVAAGADFAFVSDSSALAIVGSDGRTFRVHELHELRPQRGAPLQPSNVVASFASVLVRFGLQRVTADAHYRESIAEHLRAHSLSIAAAPEGQQGKATSYLALRELVNEARIVLPRHARLIAQLKAIVSKPTPGGGLSIMSPRRAGFGHGDLVSALVLGAWAAREATRRPRRQPYRGGYFGPV
jgi:hypothetical protein